jgi:hypothetical protein
MAGAEDPAGATGRTGAGGSDLEEQVAALEEGRGFLDLRGWRLAEIGGLDAERWLNDLATARVEGLRPGRSVRSFLLSPTGRIRADLHVLRCATEPAFVLVQGPGQPADVAALLAPYVLSSDVSIGEGHRHPAFLVPDAGAAWRVTESPPRSRLEVSERAYEAWRIRHAIPRFPVDLDPDSLPAEAGLDQPPLIDREKGCYLGQESVARVRNLGHPPRVVVAVQLGGTVAPGERVFADGEPAGIITSVDGASGAGLARVRWEAAGLALRTEGGTPVRPR